MTNDMRLDKYLTLKFPNHSRAFLKSQIKSGNILVGGKTKKPSYVLKENDKVEININIKERETTQLEPNPSIKLNIIYEDKNVIAIDKPAGISTHPVKRIYEVNSLRGSRVIRLGANFTRHPAKPDQTDTIANALLAYYPAIKEVGDEPNLRPGIVHRLDKDTSGILIIAKNNQAFSWLKEQFAQRKVEKKYTALVTGKLKNEKGIINKPIGRTKDFRKRTTVPLKERREAVTYYKVIEIIQSSTVIPAKAGIHAIDSRLRGNDKLFFTLIEAEPKTGRTHQIRVHLASIGHPLAGDKLYGFKNQICPTELKRHFLHASRLKISLPDDKMVELKSELPRDLKQVLDNLAEKKA